MLPFMLPSFSSVFKGTLMRVLLAGGRRVEVKVVGDVGVGEGDGVAARAEDARDGGVGARGQAAEKKSGLTGGRVECQGCHISYSSKPEEVVTVRTTGAAAWTRLTTVADLPAAEPPLLLPLLTTRLVTVWPPVDERELDTVVYEEGRI